MRVPIWDTAAKEGDGTHVEWPARLTSDVVARFYRDGSWIREVPADFLERAARERPDAVALVDARRRLTFGEYYDEVRNLACALVELGLGRDDVLAIQLPNGIEFALAVNAAMLAGIPFCQFHHGFRRKEAAFVLGFSGARAVVVAPEYRGFDYFGMLDELRGDLPRLEHVIATQARTAGALDLRAMSATRAADAALRRLAERRPRSDDLCRMAFTSGTTGDPKAVVHTYNTSLSTVRSSVRDQRVDAESAIVLFLPVGLNWGLSNTLQSIVAGCKLIYLDRFDAADVLHTVERERITHFVTAPASLSALIDAAERARYDLSSLQVIVSGGASCPVDILRRAQRVLHGTVVEMYGMLESGVQTRTGLDDDPDEVAGTVGRVVREANVRVADDDDREVAAGTMGEIQCFGPSVMLEYYRNPDANRRAFADDGYFRTGDLGIFDERGLLRIVGRKKEMIIRGGANIYPRELEEVLFEHPKVADCAVVGEPHPRLGEIAVACVVVRGEELLTFDEMIAFLEPRVARYKLPERLAIVEGLPRTPTGKVQKGSLAALIARG